MTADHSSSALLPGPETCSQPLAAATAASEVQVGTHSVPQRYLYAHASRGEVLQHVRTQASPDDRRRLPAILARWDSLRLKVNALEMTEAGLADTITVRALPSEAEAFCAATLADPLVAQTFDSWNHQIAVVETDKLVIPQRVINEDYIEQLTRSYPPSPDLDDLLRICFSPPSSTPPIQHLEVAPNTHAFTSPNTDLRFLGAFLKDAVRAEDTPLVEAGGLPAAAVVGFIGYGTPVINAYVVGTRIILANGHHRVYALRKLGISALPILLLEVPNPVTGMPPVIGGTPRELSLVPRPPLLKDFQEEDLSIALNVKQRIRQLTLMMNANQYDIPA